MISSWNAAYKGYIGQVSNTSQNDTKPCEMKDKKSFKVLAEVKKYHCTSSKADVLWSLD